MRFFLTFCCLWLAINLSAQNSFLDPTFGNNGIVLNDPPTLPGASCDINALIVQPDGKILVAGLINGNAGVVRYLPNGTRDNLFGVGGVFADPNLSLSKAKSIVLQPDGKILIEGMGWQNGPSGSSVLTIRLNPNGTPDSSFAQNGILFSNFTIGGTDEGCGIALQADGKIVITGSSNNTFFGLIRLLPSGSLDTSFGDSGIVVTMVPGDPTGIGILSDGKIIVGGLRVPQYKFIAMRFLSNGTIDTSFNHTGIATILAGDTYDLARCFLLQPDGKTLVGGIATFGNDGSNFALTRFMQDGSIDAQFGNGGIASVDFNHNDDELQSISLRSDGEMLLAGSTTNINTDFAIARLDSNGKIDSSFGDDGRILTSIPSNIGVAYAITSQNDGKILAGGSSKNNNRELVLVRYTGVNVSIPKIPLTQSKILFPNPTSDVLEIDGSIEKVVDITAFDLNGNTIHFNDPLHSRSVDVHNLPNGMYLFKMSFADKQPLYQKINIQR